MKLRLHPLLNLNEIGFGDRISKSVDDVSADKFEDFGVYVGQLYQKFLKKDISADPAIAQKILDLVSDDEKLMNQVKDLEFLVNQLPDRPEPKGKIGFKESLNEEKENRYVTTMDMYVYAKDDYMARVESHKLADLLKSKYDNQASVLDIVEQPFGTMGNRKLKSISKPTGKDEEMPFESYHPINSLRDLIDKDFLDIPDGSVGEIKRAAIKLGIDPQNRYESELRDEIDELLTSAMSDEEEMELFINYFGDYADEIAAQHGLELYNPKEHPHDLPPDDKGIEEKVRGYVKENLRNWFKKEKWKRIDTQGNIA